jgi:fructokinase
MEIDQSAGMRIGIDLGGTKIEAVALDQGGVVLARKRIATPSQDYQAIVRAIAGLVGDLESETGRQGTLGVGIPGAISPATGLVKNANTVVLIGKALDRDLAAATGRPVRLANDANCFALSEATDGAAAGLETVFGVIIGTGCGGGLVIHGRVLSGANAIAGEWGHNPLPWPTAEETPGPDCYCGKKGCIETWVSGPGLAADHARATGSSGMTAVAVARSASAGDPAAEATLQRHTRRLARSLATVINLLDPDAIVLGGGLSSLPHLYQDIPALWGQWVLSDTVTTRLLPPMHGDSSGVRGAAWLWPMG